MHSVIETVENGHPTSVAVQSVWLKNGKLYWPPGKNIDRKTPSVPQENWLEYDYKLLKSSIGNNYCYDNANKYHEKCATSTLVHPTAGSTYHRLSPVKKPVAKGLVTSVKRKAEPVKENHQTAKKAKKGLLPFQNNYLKSGISKAKDRVVSNGTKPKRPRYDNFLKSGKRLEIPSKAKAKKNIVSATVTKAQYLMQTGKTSEIDLDGENGVAAIENIGGTSTPDDIEENRYRSYISANNGEGLSDFLNARRGSVERFAYSGHTELKDDFQTNSALVQDIPGRAAATTLSQSGMSFEERVLKELNDLRKTQESFETRIETRIENFFNQSQMKANGQSQMRGSTQSRMQGAFRYRMEDNRQSRMHSGHYGEIRNGTRQTRYREPVSPVRYVDNFEEFEELDKKFPVNDEETVEELEFTVRRDLDFKLLLKSRLHELGGNKYKKCIRLRMQYLFTNQALELYTWWGTEEKSPFKNLRALNNLILASVREQCPNTRADEYKDYVQTWLKHARSRQRKVTYTYPAGKNLRENIENRYDEDDEDDDDDDNDENNH